MRDVDLSGITRNEIIDHIEFSEITKNVYFHCLQSIIHDNKGGIKKYPFINKAGY